MNECPKRMDYGPCGGVRPGLLCEMAEMRCTFPHAVSAPDTTAGIPPASVPLVLTDLGTPSFDPSALTRTAEILAPACDAVLVSEHHDRPDYPPNVVARMLLEVGVRPWITLACRDRNRVVLEQDLRGLQIAGVDAVLCVTGDGRGPGVRPDVTQVWDLDGQRLAALAASLGITAVVPESPTAPPVQHRAARLVGKQRSGAALAVLNHVSDPADAAAFMATARAAGLTMPVLACVAIYTDEYSAAGLAQLPGLELNRDTVAAVLRAPDPVEAGIRATVEAARELLAVAGIVGVNVSGSATTRGWEQAAQIKAEVGHRIRAGHR